VTWVVTTDLGTVTVPASVLAGIATRAAESVEGVRVRRRRTVDLDGGAVRLTVAIRRGEPVAELAGRAQDQVAATLLAMCGVEPKVDVSVVELA
jgi:uncharacterized alkaline shock family protein YloU